MVPNFSCNAYFYYISGVFAQLLMHSLHFVPKTYVVVTVRLLKMMFTATRKWTKNVIAARLLRLFFHPSLFCDFRCCVCFLSHDALTEVVWKHLRSRCCVSVATTQLSCSSLQNQPRAEFRRQSCFVAHFKPHMNPRRRARAHLQVAFSV